MFQSSAFRIICACILAICLVLPTVPAGAGASVREPSSAGPLRPVSKIGMLADYAPSGSGPLVIHIQDLHCNPEAQRNIHALIEQYSSRYPGIPILAEGAPRGPVDLAPLRALPDEVRAKTFNLMLSKGLMSGGEYAALLDSRDRLYGLEDSASYEYARRLYRALLYARQSFATEHAQFEEYIRVVASRQLSLRQRRVRRFIAERTHDDSWYHKLPSMCELAGVSLHRYPMLNQYLHARTLSRTVHIKRVRQQAEAFVNALKTSLSYGEFSALSGALGDSEEMWPALERHFNRMHASDREQYPDLSAFLASQKALRTIQPVALNDEEHAILREMCQTVPATQRQRDAFMLTYLSRLFVDGLNATLTAQGYDSYAREQQRLRYLFHVFGLDSRFPGMTGPYVSGLIEQYYATNVKRDRIFSGTVLQTIADAGGKLPAVIVITGGFHRGLGSLLRERGVSYLSVLPVVTSSTGSAVYERLMAGSGDSGRTQESALAPLLTAAGIAEADQTAYFNILFSMADALSVDGKVTPAAMAGYINAWGETLPCRLSAGVDGSVCRVTGNTQDGRQLSVALTFRDGRVAGYDFDNDGQTWVSHMTALGRNVIDLVMDVAYEPSSTLAQWIWINLNDGVRAEPWELREKLENDAELAMMVLHKIFGSRAPAVDRDTITLLENVAADAFVEMLGKSVPGMKRPRISIVVSNNPALMSTYETWDISTIKAGAHTTAGVPDAFTLYIHQSFITRLRERSRDDQQQLLKALALHEVREYAVLNLSDYCAQHPIYAKFGEYIRKKTRAGEMALPTSETFHAFSMADGALKAHESSLQAFAQQVVDVELTMRYLLSGGRDEQTQAIMAKALAQSWQYHSGSESSSAQKCFNNCVSAARMVAKWGGDLNTVLAVLFHHATDAELESVFDDDTLRERLPAVRKHIQAMRACAALPFVGAGGITNIDGASTLDNYMKMVVKITRGDFGSMLMVFADSLLSLDRETSPAQRQIFRDRLMNISVPLAMRLDYQDIAEDLRNGMFMSQDPVKYDSTLQEIEDAVHATCHVADLELQKFRTDLQDRLIEAGIDARVKARVKGVYSVWEKIKSDRRQEYDSVAGLDDLMGIHIIVKDPRQKPAVERVIVEMLSDNNRFAGPHNQGKPRRLPAHEIERGFSRVKYSFTERKNISGKLVGRPFELVIFDEENYQRQILGVWDDMTVEYGNPQFAYKLGVKSAENPEIEGVIYRDVSIAENVPLVAQMFRADNIRFQGDRASNVAQLYDAYVNNEYVAVIAGQNLVVIQLPAGSTIGDLLTHRYLSPALGDTMFPDPVILGHTYMDDSWDGKTLRTGMIFAFSPDKTARDPFAYGVPATVRGRLFHEAALMSEQARIARAAEGESLLTDIMGEDDLNLARNILEDMRLRLGLRDAGELYLAVGTGVVGGEFVRSYLQNTERKKAVCVRMDVNSAGNIDGLRASVIALISKYYTILEEGQEVETPPDPSVARAIDADDNTSYKYFRFIVDKKPGTNGRSLASEIDALDGSIRSVRVRTVIVPHRGQLLPENPLMPAADDLSSHTIVPDDADTIDGTKSILTAA